MKNFGIGLGLGLAGLGVWMASSGIQALAELAKAETPWCGKPLMIVGFSTMFLGPLIFWLILPIIKFIRRRRGL